MRSLPKCCRLLPCLVMLLGGLLAPSLAQAETPGPGWELSATTYPSNLEEPREGLASGTIGIDVFNIGAAKSEGTIAITDTLPPGLTAREAGALSSVSSSYGEEFGLAPRIQQSGKWDCTGNGSGPAPSVEGATVVTCTNDPTELSEFAGGGGTPTFTSEPLRHPQPAVGIVVDVEAGAASGTKEGAEANNVVITGGGAPSAVSTADPVTIGDSSVRHGITQLNSWFSNANGTIDRQAGSHPYEGTFVFDVATTDSGAENEGAIPGSEIRDLETEVPPGLIGDLAETAQCTRAGLLSQHCPPASMVGRLHASAIDLPISEQVYNMAPSAGTPAELGFNYGGVAVYITFTVKTGSTYGIVAHVSELPEYGVYQGVLTLWGAPGETSHNIFRHGAGGCSQEEMEGPPYSGSNLNFCQAHVAVSTPILRLPTACVGQPVTIMRETHGWQEPDATSQAESPLRNAADEPVPLTGCQELTLEPAFATSLDTAVAESPTGLTAEIKPPRSGFDDFNELTPSDIEGTTVTLPEGLVVNPGQAAGLQACPAGRPGPGRYGDAITTPEEGAEDTGAASCPAGAKVGKVIIKSPLLEGDPEKQLEGNVYVLESNPPEIKLLIAASADGVNVKVPGVVRLNEATGRLQATFADLPQLPFSDFELEFESGARAALDTPTRCSTANSVEADFVPWSAPLSAGWQQQSQFAITEGVGGVPCPGSALPFAPTFSAGSTNAQAGAFTTFTTQLTRAGGQQRVEKLQFTAPEGLAGVLSGVPLCPEPAAEDGTCAESSKIGQATVTAGPGSYTLTLPQPGEPTPAIYLTGPYNGAPFGLSIVTPVIAGPFDLGTIVTRARIEINPRTAQVTITTDPLPQIVKGVPTDLRSIEAVIDRPGFMFNPTHCTEATFSGSAVGTGAPGISEAGVTAPLSSRFEAGGCRNLAFTPQLSVGTGARASKARGQSLSVKISYPRGAMGKQAWFKEAKLDIPKQLPAEDRTLQQACLVATFEANRPACPKHSIIGTAVVHTPVLPVPLTGPVYFVSHGGAKFPDVVMVLSGDNVNITLTGETLIKNGVTSATFHNLPDVPFESFEVELPAGEYSEFGGYVGGANQYDFCGQKLSVPTFLKAQNGLEIHESVPVVVQGCSTRISVSSAKVKGRSLTLSVYVPAAGKLRANGQGLSAATKLARGQELVTLSLHATRGGSFRSKVKLSFSPTKGKKQSASKNLRI